MVRVDPGLGGGEVDALVDVVVAVDVRELVFIRCCTDALMLLMLSLDERKKFVTRCGILTSLSLLRLLLPNEVQNDDALIELRQLMRTDSLVTRH
jgi:hypothetical protein